MGCLVDTFIIRQKPEFTERFLNLKESCGSLIEHIPSAYHEMFTEICVMVPYMESVMEVTKQDHIMYITILHETEKYMIKGISFDNKFRVTCLKSIIRRMFYDTLLIIENDYNEMKFDQYIIVAPSGQVITEKQLVELPE